MTKFKQIKKSSAGELAKKLAKLNICPHHLEPGYDTGPCAQYVGCSECFYKWLTTEVSDAET